MKRILLIRHAESFYNEYLSASFRLNQVDDFEENLILFTRFAKKEVLLDPLLSAKGYRQIEEQRKSSSKLLSGVKLVISTCMTRTLETTKELFKEASNDCSFVVIPSFECVNSMSDFPFRAQENVLRYPGFDFHLVNRELDKHGFEWFIHRFVSPYKRDYFLGAVRSLGSLPKEQEIVQKSFEIIERSKKFCISRIENSFEFYFRLELAKRMITHLLRKPQYRHLEDDQVALVAHWNFLGYLSSTSFDQDFHPTDFSPFSNCEVRKHQLKLSDYVD